MKRQSATSKKRKSVPAKRASKTLKTSTLRRQLLSAALIVGAAALIVISCNLSEASSAQILTAPTLPTPASLFTPKPFPTYQPTVVKPAKSSRHTATACTVKQAEILFAACPTLSLNFATQPTGSPSNKVFNTYIGKPVANQEAELYTNSQQNLRVANGNLILQARNDPRQGFKYTSARIDTEGKENFLYGKLVVRATLPDAIGTWPAIWLLPANNKYEDLSPPSDSSRYLNGGEIDFAESVGTQPHVVYGVAHSLAYLDGTSQGYYSTITVPDNDTTFHNYGLEWTPTSLTFTIDGNAYFTMNKQKGADYRSWPYNQPFYLILNLALGGSWGGTDRQQFPTDGVDSSSLPTSMKVQSINYYPYVGARAGSKN